MLFVGAATAPPAVHVNRAYICFFDTGSAELSPRCQDIILEFVARWHRTRRGEERAWPDGAQVPAYAMRVEVEGHADAAEAEAGEAAASRARAEAVAGFLRLNDVPADVIEVAAFGADRPLALTAGPEPQNGRVQFIPR